MRNIIERNYIMKTNQSSINKLAQALEALSHISSEAKNQALLSLGVKKESK